MAININGENYLSLDEVLQRVQISQASLYEKMRYNCFPKPFKPQTRTFWKESEIDSYLEKTRERLEEKK